MPGEETLVAGWAALARTSRGARLVRSATAVVAVFPEWEPLNNAIGEPTVVTEVGEVFADAGVDTWALWVRGRATGWDAPDEVDAVPGLTRDTTTVVMTARLAPGAARTDGVVRTSLTSALRAGDEPVPVAELGAPETVPGLAAWVLVRDELAVTGAWTYRHGTDLGVYTVGTPPALRRQGLATTLLRHLLADAERADARTASLQSTRMATGLYESLGFAAVGRYEEWIRRP
jgi:ribosomal protein S18 acetylase RimI-like enzyme